MTPYKGSLDVLKKRGFIRPTNGGHGKKLANMARAGLYEVLMVEETTRRQAWYRPIEKAFDSEQNEPKT